jgi:hypothetical protein
MINEIMIKKYEQFTNEALKIGAYSQEWDSLTKGEIENLKGKMNLKKGDPLKFTGPRRMLYLAPNAFRVISGHDLEGAPLTFVEWATPDEIRKAVEPGASVGGRYSRKYVKELTDTELESFLIAKCEVPSGYKFTSRVRSYGEIGGYYYITMFTYNPKYKAKIPEKLDSQKLKALAELVASSLGTDLKISGDEGDEGVRFYTWYISCRNLKGDSSVIAGPFGKKENAEKALEEMKKNVSPKGDLEKDLLQSWKVGIGKLAPEDWYVDKSRHHFSNEEFTRAVSKHFDIPLQTLVKLSKEQLLSRIGAKRLGLL